MNLKDFSFWVKGAQVILEKMGDQVGQSI